MDTNTQGTRRVFGDLRQISWAYLRFGEERFAPIMGSRLLERIDASWPSILHASKSLNPQWGPRMEVEEGFCWSWKRKVACICHQKTWSEDLKNHRCAKLWDLGAGGFGYTSTQDLFRERKLREGRASQPRKQRISAIFPARNREQGRQELATSKTRWAPRESVAETTKTNWTTTTMYAPAGVGGEGEQAKLTAQGQTTRFLEETRAWGRERKGARSAYGIMIWILPYLKLNCETNINIFQMKNLNILEYETFENFQMTWDLDDGPL